MLTLHTAGTGHGDVRWPNLIQAADDLYCIIDLEGSLPLNSRPSPHDYPLSWHYGAVLVEGCYTAASDFWQVGKLLESAISSNDQLGMDLAQQLLGRSTRGEDLLRHAW